MIAHSRNRREVFGQLTPLAARCRNILDRLPDSAHVNRARSTNFGAYFYYRGNQFPLLIATIACIAKVISVIVKTSDLCPGHLIPKTVNIDPFDRKLPGLWRDASGALVPVPQADRNDVQSPGKSGLRW